MIALGIFMIILGILCVPVAAGLVHFNTKIWLSIVLSILACILIVAGALVIGLVQLENMNNTLAVKTLTTML